MDFRENILQMKAKKEILIAAHRGTSGGSIINNTIPAYENALRHKADILEIDAALSKDGVFYAFHDGTEPLLLGNTVNIRKMDAAYIDSLYLHNPSLELTSERPNRLEDVFDRFRGRCLINIDRSYFYWKEILTFIKKTDMESQIVIKSAPCREQLQMLESLFPKLAYMPILRSPEEEQCIGDYRINYCMAELVFDSLDAPVVSASFLNSLKSRDIMLWGNAITLNEWSILAAEKDDSHAITEGPENTWGWFVENGFDVIQTDWPMLLREYLDEKLNRSA